MDTPTLPSFSGASAIGLTTEPKLIHSSWMSDCGMSSRDAATLGWTEVYSVPASARAVPLSMVARDWTMRVELRDCCSASRKVLASCLRRLLSSLITALRSWDHNSDMGKGELMPTTKQLNGINKVPTKKLDFIAVY